MSYDLFFFRLRPGQTFEEAQQEMESDEDHEVPPPIDTRAVANALVGLNIGLIEFPKDYDEISLRLSISVDEAKKKFPEIELNTKELEHVPIQLLLNVDGIAMTLPYWEFTPAVWDAIRAYWDGIVPTVFVNGMVGYDGQLRAKIGDKSFDKMMAHHISISKKLPSHKDPIKPWWKFW